MAHPCVIRLFSLVVVKMSPKRLGTHHTFFQVESLEIRDYPRPFREAKHEKRGALFVDFDIWTAHLT